MGNPNLSLQRRNYLRETRVKPFVRTFIQINRPFTVISKPANKQKRKQSQLKAGDEINWRGYFFTFIAAAEQKPSAAILLATGFTERDAILYHFAGSLKMPPDKNFFSQRTYASYQETIL